MNNTLNPFQISPLLQNYLATPVAGFIRQRNYGYASLQKPTTGTRQLAFRSSGEI